MRESRTYGSVRGAFGNGRSYRDQILLVHEVEVLAFAQARVDRAARERTALGPLACPAALDGMFQPPAGFLIVQQLRPAGTVNLCG